MRAPQTDLTGLTAGEIKAIKDGQVFLPSQGDIATATIRENWGDRERLTRAGVPGPLADERLAGCSIDATVLPPMSWEHETRT